MVLRTVAMAMGILGGTLGLIVGLLSFFLPTTIFISPLLVLPLLVAASAIAGVKGAGIIRSKPLKGSRLMAAASIVLISVMFLSFLLNSHTVFGAPLFFYLSPTAALFIVGAILGRQSINQS